MSFEELKNEILKDGVIDLGEVEELKSILFEDGVIDRNEADLLFDLLDNATTICNEFEELFINAIKSHVLDDETSKGILDDEESEYLIEKIMADNSVSSLELKVMLAIISEATSVPEKFIQLTASALKKSILEDGIIDVEEVEMIKQFIYGNGGSNGNKIDQFEADLLFELNDAVSGQVNCSEWKETFVEAISKYLLEDENSPGAIDQNESNWLISKIENDEEYDETEKALLLHIKEHATEIPPTLKFKLDLIQI